MPSERKLNVSLSMKIKSESTSVKVLPFNVAVLIHSFVHIGCHIQHDDYISLFIMFVPLARHKVYYLFHLRNIQ
jgi:hypothetical protein